MKPLNAITIISALSMLCLPIWAIKSKTNDSLSVTTLNELDHLMTCKLITSDGKTTQRTSSITIKCNPGCTQDPVGVYRVAPKVKIVITVPHANDSILHGGKQESVLLRCNQYQGDDPTVPFYTTDVEIPTLLIPDNVGGKYQYSTIDGGFYVGKVICPGGTGANNFNCPFNYPTNP